MEDIKGLMLLADGVEETEAVSAHDILTRAGISLTPVSIKDCHRIHTSMGMTIRVDTRLKDFEDLSAFDFLILPGGKLGVTNLKKSKAAINCIKYFHDNKKLLCAICAAPSILGELGYLDNKKFTCFPGFEVGKGIKDDATGVAEDELLITGRSMYFTIPFAERIVKHYLGQAGVDKIYHGTRGADLKA
ncbi:MAG: DJ-1/PfpI family protein [Bacilli bacterium]|jgi:4-methyl-5(b-hydroxyethyl)-thiazole monophosphate biosynthesis|nr:DJ-1/PfpI family protein [Bacilli bacterium]